MRLNASLIPTSGLWLASTASAQDTTSTGGVTWPTLLLWAGGGLLALWIVSRWLPAAPRRQRAENGPNPEELRALARDLEELADRLAERLDAKAERLETLLRQADGKLESMTAAPTYSPVATRAKLNVENATDPATQRIYDLADRGTAAREIAQQLDEPIGKVQLILALRG